MKEEEFKKLYIDFSKPFIDSIKGIYKTMIMTEVTPAKPILKESNKSLGDYSAIMGITGEVDIDGGKKPFKGTLVISWPNGSYLKTSSKMLGTEYTEMNDDINDLGMEICNMTMGGAKNLLAEKGFSVELSIPTAIQGKDHVLHVEEKVITVVTPFDSEVGQFFVELNFDIVS